MVWIGLVNKKQINERINGKETNGKISRHEITLSYHGSFPVSFPKLSEHLYSLEYRILF